MIHFTPTLGIKDTAKNANGFVKNNMETFWKIFKPLAPYIIALYLLDLIVTTFFMPIDIETGEPYDFPLGEMIAGYFYTCLAITWHRVVIHGADKYEPMNPFKPKKSELAFIGMGIALFLMMVLIGGLVGLSAAIINKILFILLIPAILTGMWLWTRLMFYFPAKATNKHLTLKQSFAMTKGYVWKMIACSFWAYLKLFFMLLAYIILGFAVLAGIGFLISSLEIDPEIPGVVLGGLYALPLIAFFQPLFAVIWVTVLSNYYQYALQNDGVPEVKND